MRPLDDRYLHKSTEEKLNSLWENQETYKWRGATDNSFVIDTPPPTISGTLHMGHVFSYCHTDFIARYQRMSGKDVFYPIGFDDNGLPTERLVEKIKGIKASKLKREEFIEECKSISHEFRQKFRKLFRSLGISCDWHLEYHTMSEKIQKISQASFLELYAQGKLYREQKPTLWDTINHTAIAHAEIEEREFSSAMNTISFSTESGLSVNIATTRPELIPACVALFFNPEDDRYSHLHNQTAIVPVGGQRVRIIPDDKVRIDKGTGVVMCCTFGDELDVHWWHTHKLDTRIIVDKRGRLNLEESDDPSAAQFNGMRVKEAREAICKYLEQKGLLIAQEPIIHTVKCAERSGEPVEILMTPQWFVGVVEHKHELLEHIRNNISWHPESMRKRLEIWVENLNWDWCISRQRYFGVPFPLWYSKRKGEEGKVLLPRVEDLPINPAQSLPEGYGEDEIEPETDVMDTWATSSLSPQFITGSVGNTLRGNKNFDSLFPADMRAQSHEIIRSWAFYTILKSYYHNGSIPWKNIVISGWCLAKDKTKMSKSKGNAMDPEKILEMYGADVVRYWSAKSRLGVDTVFSEDVLKTGKKLVTKLWNASKFVCSFPHSSLESVSCPTDLWILSKLHKLVTKSTESFSDFEYCVSLGYIEEFFWKDFCDNYLELVKYRAYNGSIQDKESGTGSLYCILKTLLLLLAPFLPYVTEEIYGTIYGNSIHLERWPCADSIPCDDELEKYGEVVLRVIEEVRKAKTHAQVSIKYPVQVITIRGLPEGFPEAITQDLKHVCCAEKLITTEGPEILEVSVVL